MKTKKIVRQFTCSTKINNTETFMKISAIVRASYSKNYVLRCESIQYKDGEIIMNNMSDQYYNNGVELKSEFEYTYELCKNNVFTTSIQITK